MRSLAFSGVALAALIVAQPALAQTDSGVGAPPIPDKIAPIDDVSQHRAVRRLERSRPTYGFQLPEEWMSDEYAVDYRQYRLDRPARGFGWSRYRDDIVLTDQWGRVYDVAGEHDRGRAYRERETEGLAGGVAGAAAGAVAGNIIAGAGSRLAGSLIGGGVGALAGLAVERAISRNRQRGPRYDDRAHEHDGGHQRGHWNGRHWGGHAQQAWGHHPCGCGETVTTTTVTYHGGGGSYMVPREVVTYENVYAPARTKYRARAVAPATDGKTRVRTRLYTKTY